MKETWTLKAREREALTYATGPSASLGMISHRATQAASLLRDHVGYEVDWSEQMVFYDPALGSDISRAFDDAISINQITSMKVVFDFNGRRITVEEKPKG